MSQQLVTPVLFKEIFGLEMAASVSEGEPVFATSGVCVHPLPPRPPLHQIPALLHHNAGVQASASVFGGGEQNQFPE